MFLRLQPAGLLRVKPSTGGVILVRINRFCLGKRKSTLIFLSNPNQGLPQQIHCRHPSFSLR
uniref:Uncharacterized protein MANES_09G112700 n=1 Tax=Rhizophora mucronata TaxID=61149 RepID=A0A2P2JWD9_RHIMU